MFKRNGYKTQTFCYFFNYSKIKLKIKICTAQFKFNLLKTLLNQNISQKKHKKIIYELKVENQHNKRQTPKNYAKLINI